jgi:hypothetical protein
MTESESQSEREPDTQAELAAMHAQLFPQQMSYRLISGNDQHAMITERVAALEREHFAKQLLMWENQGRPDIEQSLLADMAEIQRRIELHIGAPVQHDHEAEHAAKLAAEQAAKQQPELAAAGDPSTNGAGDGPDRAARRARQR